MVGRGDNHRIDRRVVQGFAEILHEFRRWPPCDLATLSAREAIRLLSASQR